MTAPLVDLARVEAIARHHKDFGKWQSPRKMHEDIGFLLDYMTRLAEAVGTEMARADNCEFGLDMARQEISAERADNARLRLKNEQYQAMLDDKWAGVVTLVNGQTDEVARLRAALEGMLAVNDYTPPDRCLAIRARARAALASRPAETTP